MPAHTITIRLDDMTWDRLEVHARRCCANRAEIIQAAILLFLGDQGIPRTQYMIDKELGRTTSASSGTKPCARHGWCRLDDGHPGECEEF